MRLLLIDPPEGLDLRIRDMLRMVLPELACDAWRSRERGPLPGTIDADVLMFALRADAPAQLGWLRRHGGADAPASVVLLERLTPELAGEALGAGAGSVLALPELSPARLATTIRLALAERMLGGAQGSTAALPRVPGYRLLRQIGEGGMASVWLAEREGAATHEPLVVKLLDAKLLRDPGFVARFARECDSLSRVRHENVVRLIDFRTDGPRPFLAMEYFAAGDLKARIRQGLRPDQSVACLLQIARALEAVHAAGLVHRDLKPQNIMFRDASRLALADFGLAKSLDGAGGQMQLTQAGMILATPVYMSPEQCLGKVHDARGDLYSTGIILWEMLTGAPPFAADNAAALAYHHVHTPPPPLAGELAAFRPLIGRLLAKAPQARFQSARELIDHLAPLT